MSDNDVKTYAVTKTVKVEAESMLEAAKIAHYMRVPKRDNIEILDESNAVVEVDD